MTNKLEETLSYMQHIIMDAVEKTEMQHIMRHTAVIVRNKTLVVTYPGRLPESIVKLLDDVLLEIYPAHLEYKSVDDNLSQYIISLSDEQDEVLINYMSTIRELNHTFTLKKRVIIDLELQIVADSEEDAEDIFDSHISILDPTIKVVSNNDAIKDYTQEFVSVTDIE